MSTNTAFCSTPAIERGNKTHAQVKAIFGLAHRVQFDDDDIHQLVEEVTGKRSIRALNRDEADKVIAKLGGDPIVSRRTVQHRRKQAGVAQIAQPAHLQLMRDLARRRQMTDEGLAQLTRSIIKKNTPTTTAETNKVIEALKAMNRRDAR